MTRSIAVVGPGDDAPDDAIDDAEHAARLIASRGWITLCGGRASGVMAAAARGASAVGGVVIGLLPGSDRSDAAPDLAVALPTGLGEARNFVLITASDAVIACGINPGTASEVALALKAGKPVVLVRPDSATVAFFATLAGGGDVLHVAATAGGAVNWIESKLSVN